MATATSSARAAPGASLWMRRRAPASRSRPIGLEVLDRVDRGVVHQLDQRGAHGAAELDDGGGRGGDRGEGRDDRGPGRLGGDEAQGRPGDDAQGALGADEQLEQRQAGDVLDPLAAEGDQGAVGEHDVEAEHVVGGDAVLHAAQAAGVGRDVAADRADLVRAGVRRVPEALRGGGPLDLDVEGAGLDDGDPAGGVDLDGAHPLGRQHDAAVDRERPAGQARARAPRHDRDAVCARPAHGRLHLLGGLGPHGGERGAGGGVVGPVEAVLLQGVRGGHDHPVGQHPDQLGNGIIGGGSGGALHRPCPPSQSRVLERLPRRPPEHPTPSLSGVGCRTAAPATT